MADKQESVSFIVQYEGGKVAFMTVDRPALERGGAMTIAKEQQQSGQLPKGKIVKVTRA